MSLIRFIKDAQSTFCPFQCVYALEFPLVFFFFFISCAKTILFNLVSPKLVDRALSSGFCLEFSFKKMKKKICRSALNQSW